jgi:hypothetical protein
VWSTSGRFQVDPLMTVDPALQAHKDWINFVQPVGLVVSPRALIEAQAHIDVRAAMAPQQVLLEITNDDHDRLSDFARFTTELLGWRESDLLSGDALSDLCVTLTDLGDSLAPTFAVRGPEPDEWLLLVVETATGDDLDDDQANALRGWSASHQARFERLLRERDIPIGILTNRERIRLVYSPRGESTGHVTFVVRHMTEVQGRPILSALLMLLDAQRLFALGTNQRLPAILRQSRRYQNEVSERLAEQVLESLWVLLYGFQAADEFSRGELLRRVLNESPNDVYGGLLATIMRLVFTLYAEDRALLPTETTLYSENYSLLGLFETLREDNAHYPDTMTQRYGAWAQLLTLFRLLYDGASHDTFRVPPRHGRLFDPNVYPFLEGRTGVRDDDRTQDEGHDQQTIPRISDGVVYKILSNLLYLDGDRLSYAALDVEEIGSVYEAMMGFRLEITTSPSIGVKPKMKKGVRADVIIDLQKLLATKPENRAKLLKEEAATDVTGRALDALKSAATSEQIVAALGNKVSPYTPRILAKGAMALQPSEERRRSGSHYTPRSLTQPIVRTTLQPIVDQLCGDPACAAFDARNDPKRRDPVPGCIAQEGEANKHRHPQPEQILDLKVCDPAMGSGAFLVEACRYLGDALVRAWQVHGGVPPIPPDEDIVLVARRRIAQKCLYGVDRNPFAVDLAKLSLWLATLAKDHPFTFLDHALRHGDSLVGLTRDQIVHFDWEDSGQFVLELSDALRDALAEAEDKRARIHELADSDDVDEKQRLLGEAERATRLVRTAGDLLIAAFFGAEKGRDRKALRAATLESLRNAIRSETPIDDRADRELRSGEKPVPPFHWFLEFPEVFSRRNPGFVCFVGNPPFAAKNAVSQDHASYMPWLLARFENSNGKSDVVAFFFRAAFDLLAERGSLGMIATKTIAQGDTRASGLQPICRSRGTIFSAIRRMKWPGAAAVTVSVVHISKGAPAVARRLDGTPVPAISPFLTAGDIVDDPSRLKANLQRSFQGCNIAGKGFTFDDQQADAHPISVMHAIIRERPSSAERITPYLGGEDLNSRPDQGTDRFVIGFGRMELDECRSRWPELAALVEATVKSDRESRPKNAQSAYLAAHWWQWHTDRPTLQEAIKGMERILVASAVSEHLALVFQPPSRTFGHVLNIFAFDSAAAFCVLQSRVHEMWARFFGSTLEDRLRYSLSDGFETFAFPNAWETRETLETGGNSCYEHRAAVMAANDEGLTTTYNRFHNPDERHEDILVLRKLHDDMDRAVLDAYGWTDVEPSCEFILDYEDMEGDETASHRKKPWRYRWPDDVRDDVLARLLALNAERAKQEQLVGATEEGHVLKKRQTAAKGTVPLFDQTPRIVPTIVPDYLTLPDGAWIRPRTNDADEELAALAAVMKAVGVPTPIQTIRLAQCLAMEPSLLTAILDNTQSQIWIRLVGDEARVPGSRDQIAVNDAWGRAITQLRGTGRLTEKLAAQTWAPGPDLDALYTEGWPDGRAAFVLDFLSRHKIADLLATLPVSIQEWVRDIAA